MAHEPRDHRSRIVNLLLTVFLLTHTLSCTGEFRGVGSIAPVRDAAPHQQGTCCATQSAVSFSRNSEVDLRRTNWLMPDERRKRLAERFTFTDLDGRTLTGGDLWGRPIALTFVFTRCTNTARCSASALAIGKLQKQLRASSLSAQARVAIITYEPEHDSGEILRAYMTERGIVLDGSAKILIPRAAEKTDLFETLGVPVGFDADGVNSHGICLLLVDKKGRVAREYRNVLWDTDQVIADLVALEGER